MDAISDNSTKQQAVPVHAKIKEYTAPADPPLFVQSATPMVRSRAVHGITDFSRGMVNVLVSVSCNILDSHNPRWPYDKIPSHVPRMVQLRPMIERIPKFRCKNTRKTSISLSPQHNIEWLGTYLQDRLLAQTCKSQVITRIFRVGTVYLSVGRAGSGLQFVGRHDENSIAETTTGVRAEGCRRSTASRERPFNITDNWPPSPLQRQEPRCSRN